MDITRGEFDEFSTRSSLRSSRSGTRSSCRSENFSSLEILPPETDSERLFMSEELSDEDETEKIIEENEISRSITDEKKLTLEEVDSTHGNDQEEDSRESQSSSRSNKSLFHELDDPELRKAIEKMRKYDRILVKKVKREKEVKRQRLVFYKQMVQQMVESPSDQSDVAANTNKYLALMPSGDQLDRILLEMEEEETNPIFQTQYMDDIQSTSSPYHQDADSPALSSDNGSNCRKQKGRSDDSAKSRSDDSAKSRRDDSAKIGSRSKNGKTDFVKRNIELAKDAGSYVSMTDDEKKRLNELLSDLDNLDLEKDSTEGDAFTTMAIVAGQGYTPNELDMRRLEEIDERIQMLMPDSMSEQRSENSFHHDPDILDVAQRLEGQSSYDAQERLQQIQEKLERFDDEWRNTFQQGTPRLTEEELKSLLDQCSRTNSALSSSRIPSQMSSIESDSNRSTPRTLISSADDSEFSEDPLNRGEGSLSRPLSRGTLDKLLLEARSSLGISDLKQGREDSDAESDSTIGGDFQHILPPLTGSRNSSLSNHPSELDMEDFTPSHTPVLT